MRPRSSSRILRALAPLRARGAEVIVVDSGSADGTPGLAAPLADRVVAAPRGRGAPMNLGATLGAGDALLFLHADTALPDKADGLIAQALERRAWGRFDLRIAGRHPFLAVVARMINWRSRWSGIATGDQAMFMTRAAFEAVGGFPDLPLMEDVALSRRLKRLGPAVLHRDAGHHIGPPLGISRRVPHHLSDVAAAACLLPRRRTRELGVALPGGEL